MFHDTKMRGINDLPAVRTAGSKLSYPLDLIITGNLKFAKKESIKKRQLVQGGGGRIFLRLKFYHGDL